MRENQLRFSTYPFDWMHTFVHEGFLAILEEDFQHFADEHMLLLWNGLLENRHYQIEFRHEAWPLDREKYARRMARFRELDSCPEPVVFLRAAYTYENDPAPCWDQPEIDRITPIQAIELRDLLNAYFPHLAFTLAIVNDPKVYPAPFPELYGIREFKVRRDHTHEDYRTLFQEMKGQ